MKTVLATGAAGYIGSTLCGYLLRAGYRVIAVDNLDYDNAAAIFGYLGEPEFEFIHGDATDPFLLNNLIPKCDAIIPLAAIVGAPACDKRPSRAKAVNRDAIKQLVSIASPGQRIIYCNTNSGYGQTNGTSFCVETDELKPISLYGKTKCDAEELVLGHSNHVVFRLATVFGASHRMRFDLLVNDFTYRLSRIKYQSEYDPAPVLEIFEPFFKRNYVHVRDVCRAICFALKNEHLGGVYNLGLPEANLTKLQLAQIICDTLCLSYDDAYMLGTGEDVDKRNYLVSSDKIKHAGFQFEHSLKNGIKEVSCIAKTITPEQHKKMRNIA